MPDARQQPEGATNSWVLLPRVPTGDWFRPISSDFLVRRTKCNPHPSSIYRCSRSHEPQRPRHNLTEQIYSVNENFFSFENKFWISSRKVLVSEFAACAAASDTGFRRTPACEYRYPAFHYARKFFSLKTEFRDHHSAFALHRICVRFSSRKSSTIFAHALWAVLIRLGGLMEAVVRRGHL